MRIIGVTLYSLGAIASLLIDVAASFWLYAAHGIGWVILAWMTMLPLLILPFLAGLGAYFVVTLIATFIGAALVDNA